MFVVFRISSKGEFNMTEQNYDVVRTNGLVKPDYEAIVVGAGFGGMGAAIELKKLGFDSIKIIERSDGLGGTWHLNTYPGVAVDIPSSTYSYSFEPNPYWSRLYAPGGELKAYAEHVANKYDLRRHMQFNLSVDNSSFDEKNKIWTINLNNGETYTSRILILATGFLSQPKKPNIPGLESFNGKVIHTANWDHEYDLTNKNIAIIGTGATSVQLVPELAKKAKNLDVYQRTAIWVVRKHDFSTPEWVKEAFSRIPLTQKVARSTISGILELGMVTAALRYKQFSFLAKKAQKMGMDNLYSQVKDPKLREQLTPKYDFGCKRPTFSNDYFSTFEKDNVSLITDSIAHIEKDGIVSGNEELRKIDTLVLATGFKMWEKGNFPAFEVYGIDEVELGEHWYNNGYENYDGIAVNGFPNFYNLSSPYGFTGLSYFYSIEAQMKHINRCVTEMKKRDALSFEVTAKAQKKFITQMKKNLKNSIIVQDGACQASNSYYFNGRQTTLIRPTSTYSALKNAESFPLKDYQFS